MASDFIKSLSDLKQFETAVRNIVSLQGSRKFENDLDDLYVDLFSSSRDELLSRATDFAQSLDGTKNRFHFAYLDNFPPVVLKSTVEDPLWSTATSVIKAPLLMTVQSAIDFIPANPGLADTFTITINGTPFSHVVIYGGLTVPDVVTALAGLINAGAEPVTATDNTTKVTVVHDTPGSVFTYSTSTVDIYPVTNPTLTSMVKIDTSFGIGNLAGLEVQVLDGNFIGNFYPIAGNVSDGIDISGNMLEAGDLIALSSSDIRTGNAYDTSLHSAGNNTEIAAIPVLFTFPQVPQLKKWDERWNSIRFLRYNSRIGTKLWVDNYDSSLSFMEPFRDNLGVRDEYLDEILSEG